MKNSKIKDRRNVSFKNVLLTGICMSSCFLAVVVAKEEEKKFSKYVFKSTPSESLACIIRDNYRYLFKLDEDFNEVDSKLLILSKRNKPLIEVKLLNSEKDKKSSNNDILSI